MKEFLVQTYTIALPIVLTALMGYIVWLLKNQKKDRSANSKGTMLLLRVQLIEYHDKYTTLGEIPSYAYENFMEMYEAYHELGGKIVTIGSDSHKPEHLGAYVEEAKELLRSIGFSSFCTYEKMEPIFHSLR